MKKGPIVSVIMPAYNAQEYLQEAIESILAQSYSHFELIIINDASTDGTKEIIKSLKNERIRYIENKTNIGISACLNKGISLAQGDLIARMDADDISLVDRLDRQVDYLLKHSDVDLCGSYIKTTNGKEFHYPISDSSIKANLIFRNPFVHPAVMMRKKIFNNRKNLYDESYKAAQDYELWSRLKGTYKFATIPEVLLIYRFHKSATSTKRAKLQSENALKVQKKLIEELDILPTQEELSIHERISRYEVVLTFSENVKIVKWLFKLAIANIRVGKYSRFSFSKQILCEYLHVLL